jgi:transaldolase
VRIYLGSAMAGDLAPLLGTGAFAGVTTTPALLQRAGVLRDDVPHLVADLVAAGAREVCVPARGRDPEALLRDARRVATVHAEVTVAVPATRGGLAAAAALVREGRSVLVSAVHRPVQLLTALQTGCRWVAPAVTNGTGVPDDADAASGPHGVAGILRMQQVLDRHSGAGTRLLAAEVHDEEQLLRLATGGVAAATVPLDLATAMLDDPRTTAAVEEQEQVVDLP